MMAVLFLLMTLVIGTLFVGKRHFVTLLFFVTWCGCWLMLWHHATDALKISW